MRRLMWFTIGFAVSCCVCAYALLCSGFAAAAAACFLISLVGFLFGKERKWLCSVTAVFLGCGIGLFWYLGFRTVYLMPVQELADTEISLQITSSDYGIQTDYGTRVDGIATLQGKPCRIRVYLQDVQEIRPGDLLLGNFSMRLQKQEVSSYFQSKGIFLLAYQTDDITVKEPEAIPLWCRPAVLRSRIGSLLQTLFPEDVSPFVKALLLGDTSDLDYAVNTDLKISGIRHIVAVSGLHISILYGLICIVTLRQRFLTAAIGFPVLLLFSAVAGFTPSVTRACIMIFLMLAAQIFDREYDPATALSFSVLVMLVINPMAIASASLQMSVSCVAGMLLFQSKINNWLKKKFLRKGIPDKLQNLLYSSISVSLSAISLVTPLTALYFGTISLVSALTNLLTLWIVNLIFYGLILICLVSIPCGWLASFVASILVWPVRYVLLMSKLLASLPLAAVYTESIYIVVWLIFVYVLLIIFLSQKKRQPGVLLWCGMLGLSVALLVSWVEPLLDDVRITMLDVGQGQSILLQSEGRTWLVDCGGDDDAETADIISEKLLSQGISRLDGIVLTHYDRDHSGALDNLLTRIDTELLILPDTRNDFALPDTDAKILWVWENMELSFGNSRMVIYGPVYSGMDNENSLCVLFDTEKCDILITGDRTDFGERMLLRRVSLQDVDILVAGHHGAADSTSEQLLATVTPETVLISVKENNIYRHPSSVLLRRLEEFGCFVYRTDKNGTILIRR